MLKRSRYFDSKEKIEANRKKFISPLVKPQSILSKKKKKKKKKKEKASR